MATPVTLTGMTWNHPRGHHSLVEASRVFAEETGIHITWEARSLQAFADESIHKLAGRYDLIVLDHPHVGQIAANDCLIPLQAPENMEETSMGGSSESYFYDGKCWAYAIDATCQMAVCRPDLEVPRPSHWEDFRAPHAPSYKAITPLKPVDAFDMWLTLAASRNAAVPHSPDTFIHEPVALEGLDILRTLYKLGPAEAVGWNPIQVLEILGESDDFAYSPCLFGYVNYCRPGFKTHVLAYLDLPTFSGTPLRRSILGGTGLAVSAFSRHAEAAQSFARWVSSQAVQSGVYLQNEGQPANKKTWQAGRSDAVYAPFFDGAYETMATAWTRPRDEWFLSFVDDVCDIFPAFFTREIPYEDFLRDINQLYRKHISKEGLSCP